MDRILKPNSLLASCGYPFEYGEGDSVPIDQQSAKTFNIDPMTGRPYYDLTLVMRAQNPLERDKLLAEMQQFKQDFLPSDISDEKALEFYEPRLAQLPSEKADLLEYHYTNEYKKAKEANDMALMEKYRNKVLTTDLENDSVPTEELKSE